MTPTITRTETLLSIKDVSLVLDGKTILQNVNAHIDNLHREGDDGHTGQIVAFLGPSGCGKTSLLRILAGLQPPTSGDVFLGKNREPAAPGKVGMVSQNYLLFRNRTVMGNLMLAAMQTGLNRNDARWKCIDMLTRFDLMHWGHVYPSQLSGGQRQRVAICQQLLCSDHFLLMDEPTAGLDPRSKKKVCQLISQVANADDLNTIILVTHDIRSAIAIADTVWLMGKNREDAEKDNVGSRIMESYDLIEAGLCWHEDVQNMPRFAEVEREILGKFEDL